MHLKFIGKISQSFSIQTLTKLSGKRLFPMVYHLVGNKEELKYADGLYRIPTPEEFEVELDLLLKHYNPIDLKGLKRYCDTGELPGSARYFFLTFDDGLRQMSEIVAPILLKKGIPATFFINTGFVDNKDFIHRFRTNLISDKVKNDKSEELKKKTEEFFRYEFSPRFESAKHILNLKWKDKVQISKLDNFLGLAIDEELQQLKPYMSRNQISELISKGFTIGAHSIDHPEYYGLTENEQVEQSMQSINQIEEWYKPELNTFAFPFSDYGIKTTYFSKLNKECSIALSFGTAGLKDDTIVTNIQRIPMDDRTYGAEQRLKSELLYFLLKKPLGKNKIKR